ncbi:hypothetical protein HPB50_013956 [Hyalomma asiaticum]|uniref:Uncharacterized protein n=1 Tax=Hyalomma asiaticum TaxID=266040 RepID=A0ACB7S3Q9_HYAAI|nr:hypothetical protein HPB50_013956 [Hyalomma asiaticum]
MCAELKDAGQVVVRTSDTGGHDDKHQSSNEHLTRKPRLSWTSLALAGFVATVVGALIALAVTHMRSHKQHSLQSLPLESNNKLGSEERNSTTPYDDADAWADAGAAARRNDNFNGTDQAIMFVLNID